MVIKVKLYEYGNVHVMRQQDHTSTVFDLELLLFCLSASAKGKECGIRYLWATVQVIFYSIFA